MMMAQTTMKHLQVVLGRKIGGMNMKKKINDILSHKLFRRVVASSLVVAAMVGIISASVFAQEDNIIENNIAPKATTVSGEKVTESWAATLTIDKLYDGIITTTDDFSMRNFYTSKYSSSQATTKEIIFELDELQSINEVRLYPFINKHGAWGMPTDFTISISYNGTQYYPVAQKTGYANTNTDACIVQFATVTCKYVKITATKLGFAENDTSRYALQLTEVAIIKDTINGIETLENNIADQATITGEQPTWAQANYPLTNLVDKTVGPSSSYTSEFATNQNTTKTITFTYDKAQNVQKLVLYPHYENCVLYGFPEEFNVSVLVGQDWIVIPSDKIQISETKLTTVHVDMVCTGVKIQATKLGNSTNSNKPYNLQLSEIAIMGKETSILYLGGDEYNIKGYWKADEAQRIAPVKEGYVFGGWFATANESTPLTEEALKEAVPEKAYAKFVPAEVLSVKAQNQSGVTEQTIAAMREKNSKGETIADDQKFYVRVMSSLDSKNYTKVGFDIYLNNKKKLEGTETTKIYTGVMVEGQAQSAEEIYGGASKYLMTWRLTQIDWADNAKLIIYVRPYWVTTDGTKVYGLAKYVHIEDEYLNYINVPVNLLGGEKVIAGAVDVTSNTNEKLELVAFENGRIFKYMNYTQTGNIFKMVGNTDLDVGKYDESGETIYANLRLKKPANNTEFNIVDNDNTFCNWDEKFVDVKKVWNTKYVQEATNE